MGGYLVYKAYKLLLVVLHVLFAGFVIYVFNKGRISARANVHTFAKAAPACTFKKWGKLARHIAASFKILNRFS